MEDIEAIPVTVEPQDLDGLRVRHGQKVSVKGSRIGFADAVVPARPDLLMAVGVPAAGEVDAVDSEARFHEDHFL